MEEHKLSPKQTMMVKVRNDKRISNLEKVRVFRGLTQRELSIKSGLSIRMIQSFEQSARSIDGTHISNLCALSIALECQIENILEDAKLIEELKLIKGFLSVDNYLVENLYPQNILNDIFDNYVLAENFPDCEKTIAYLLSSMPLKWFECIKLRYQKNYTFEKIGEIVGVTKTRADQIIKKTILELKKPENLKCIELGIEQYQEYLKAEQYQKNIEKANRNLYEIPIDELELSGRAYNSLMRNDISSIGKLSEFDKNMLASLRNMGNNAAEEVINKLNKFIEKRNSL